VGLTTPDRKRSALLKNVESLAFGWIHWKHKQRAIKIMFTPRDTRCEAGLEGKTKEVRVLKVWEGTGMPSSQQFPTNTQFIYRHQIAEQNHRIRTDNELKNSVAPDR
jgi:hypothetical protein